MGSGTFIEAPPAAAHGRSDSLLDGGAGGGAGNGDQEGEMDADLWAALHGDDEGEDEGEEVFLDEFVVNVRDARHSLDIGLSAGAHCVVLIVWRE
eukprot:2648735-Prymnesium_polylepis.1